MISSTRVYEETALKLFFPHALKCVCSYIPSSWQFTWLENSRLKVFCFRTLTFFIHFFFSESVDVKARLSLIPTPSHIIFLFYFKSFKIVPFECFYLCRLLENLSRGSLGCPFCSSALLFPAVPFLCFYFAVGFLLTLLSCHWLSCFSPCPCHRELFRLIILIFSFNLILKALEIITFLLVLVIFNLIVFLMF